MPASSRQTARKDTEPHNVWGSSHAGCLLFGASFFSELDVELGLGDIDELIVRFRFYLSLGQLRPQSLQFGLEFLDIRRKFLLLAGFRLQR